MCYQIPPSWSLTQSLSPLLELSEERDREREIEGLAEVLQHTQSYGVCTRVTGIASSAAQEHPNTTSPAASIYNKQQQQQQQQQQSK